MSLFKNKPLRFFEQISHDPLKIPGLTGVIAGYENRKFRNEACADHLLEWLPEFALKYSELEDLHSGNLLKKLKKAAKVVYDSDKYAKRGEFGELLLHALLRDVFDSEPAISKIFYKSTINETVKGFDAVHVVDGNKGLELWLGEVKFYKSSTQAIYDITKEIVEHTEVEYLKREFILIDNKVDPKWPHAEAFHDLVAGNRSLDEVFDHICIPALFSYESKCVGEHDKVCDDFREALEEELEALHKKFASKSLPKLKIHLFLVPLEVKSDLADILNAKLKGLQA